MARPPLDVGDVDAEYRHECSPDAVGRAIEEIATRQHGVISAEQLRTLGLKPGAIARRVRRSELIRLHRGVYAVGHRRLTAEARQLAAVLACGPGALLSHRSAADRHGLLRSGSPRIEVSAPRGRRPRDGIVVHRPRVLDEEDHAMVDGIPVTSVARTLVDIAGVVDPTRLERALDAAERAGTLDAAAIERVLDRLPRARGRGRLLRLLERFSPEAAFTRSEAERRFLALCRRHGLPAPQANLWVAGHEIDFFWPDHRLAVEIDGRAHHSGTGGFHADRRRDRALLAVGIETARLTWDDLRESASLAGELRRILSGRTRR